MHFKATFLKRFRVIRRDLKSFIFELVLPFIIIILALLLLQVSFIADFSAQTLSISTYLTDQNPVVIPIGSDNSVYANNLQSALNTKYGSNVDVQVDSTNTAVGNFDQNFLLPKKLASSKLKGGLFFLNGPTASGGDNLYEFYTLVNTRSPTSPLLLTTLASETILNQVFSKSVTIELTNDPMPRTYQ
jgi:cytoskeletal protein RodZ